MSQPRTSNPTPQPSAVNQQLIAIETRYGAEELACTVLRALRRTIQDDRKPALNGELCREIRQVYDLLWNGKPKMAAAIHDVQKLLAWQIETPSADRTAVLNQIDELLRQRGERLRLLAEAGAPLLARCDTIFVCSYSGTVHSVLESAQSLGAKPRILIASREDDESARIASAVQGMSLNWELVDPATLSHSMEEIDMALCGAVALTACHSLVVRAGTAGLFAQLHDAQKPIYFAIASDKFTDWKRANSSASSNIIETSSSHIVLKKRSFSHDFITMDVVSGLITEVGVLARESLAHLLEARQQEFRSRDALIRQVEDGSVSLAA